VSVGGSTYTEYFAPRGAFRFPDTYRLDLQIGFEVPVWRKATFFSNFNFVNFPNHQQQFSYNTSQSVVAGNIWRPGSSFGLPTSSNNYISARTMTLSAGLKF
jgi:hypothetical protein